ncbi:GAF domain-containing protein [Geitlerinema sp. P-1104]|uniref:GAF domain-containing sensor histidine kinase n=1 Tax=Geitlerinema sp. P-1104 TaxID=2546230 RepID=UPI0014775484|nr:GAF domain-containing protein [Geitlerinema sp. P-1104]
MSFSLPSTNPRRNKGSNPATGPSSGRIYEGELEQTSKTTPDGRQDSTLDLQRQVQVANLINQINTELSSTLELEDSLNTACRLLCQTLNCSRASVFVQDDSDPDTLVTQGEHINGEYPSQMGLKIEAQDNAHIQVLMSEDTPVSESEMLEFPGLGAKTREALESLEIKSMLAIATRYQGEVNGIIGLHQCDRPRQWEDWEAQLLQGVARQLGIAIDRARLYKTSQEAAAQEAFLRLVTNKIRNTLDVKTILQTAVEGARRLLQADRVVIYQFQDDWKGRVVVEDVTESWTSVLGDMGADDCFSGEYAHLYREGRVRSINNIETDLDLDKCHANFLKKLDVKANLIVPILIGQNQEGDLPELWGLLIVHQCSSPRHWRIRESHLMLQLADQLAIAIQQAELFSRSQAQVERESLLRLMTERVRSTLDLPEILQTAVTGIRGLLDTDRVVVYQFINGQQGKWDGDVVVEDVRQPQWSIVHQKTCDDCFGGEHSQLYLQGRVRAMDDVANDPALDDCHREFLSSISVKANLIVPIVTKPANSKDGELYLWGLLLAQACEAPRQWQDGEITLLGQLSEQIAIGIQQAELYNQTKTQAQELQATLDRLQSTQLQLIQTEKLSGLGKMAAGVAHEINNANNFIFANLHYVQEYGNSLLEGLASLDTETAINLKEDLDFDYIQEDFPNMLKSMRQGSERIHNVVRSLQTFSHLNEAEIKPVNLHDCLESSLSMLRLRFHANLTINKKYSQEMPRVACYPGQVNQVFFNLIENALDALEPQPESAELSLRTEVLSEDWVRVSIADNGPGIAPEIRDLIFDPFFTTKAIGSGTGLGLSTCYQAIVQGHGGKLYLNEAVESGTEICIELPVHRRDCT